MLIDNKGRIFGKWNIIDVIVVLFILAIMPMFYYGFKIMSKKPKVIEKPPTITLDKAEYEKDKARLKKLDEWLIENKRVRKYFE